MERYVRFSSSIIWFFYLFLLCSISLLVKYDFILRYEAWVNAIRASSFIENFPQISAKPIAYLQWNLLGKLSRNRPFFTDCFSVKLASKFSAKFPRSRQFFPRICPWKWREIWLIFCDLPEALSSIYPVNSMGGLPNEVHVQSKQSQWADSEACLVLNNVLLLQVFAMVFSTMFGGFLLSRALQELENHLCVWL